MSKSVGRLATFLLLVVAGCGDSTRLSEKHGPCECSTWITVGGQGTFPLNVRKLVDGTRYDPQSALFFEVGRGSAGSTPFPGHLEDFFGTGVFAIVPDEPFISGMKYSATMKGTTGGPGGAMIMTIGDAPDTTPPIVGTPLVTGEVFTNDCGAKALVWTDSGSTDDSRFGPRLPVLVEMRSGDTQVNTFSSTFGFTNELNFNLISRAPFLGQCITKEGLETLDFEYGESVEISLTLYDYSGNAGRTVTQTIDWPIRPDGGGCGVGAAASPPSALLWMASFVWLIRTRRRP